MIFIMPFNDEFYFPKLLYVCGKDEDEIKKNLTQFEKIDKDWDLKINSGANCLLIDGDKIIEINNIEEFLGLKEEEVKK